MAKFLVRWAIDTIRVPTDEKERRALSLGMVEMVKADLKTGITKEWGAYLHGMKGYSIVEGSETEITSQLMKYAPFVKFKVQAVLSVVQLEKAMKAKRK